MTGGRPSGSAPRTSRRCSTRARDTEAWHARSDPIEIVLQNERPLDPTGEPERVAEQVERMAAAGATAINVRFVHHSPAHYKEQLAALRTIV